MAVRKYHGGRVRRSRVACRGIAAMLALLRLLYRVTPNTRPTDILRLAARLFSFGPTRDASCVAAVV